MAQHFLLSAKARSLSLKTVFRMGEDAAYGLFCEMRWPETAVPTPRIGTPPPKKKAAPAEPARADG